MNPVPFRELNWNVPGQGWLYVFLVPTLAVFLYGLYTRLWPCLASPREKERHPWKARLRNLWQEAILQQRVRRQKFAGRMHWLVFWGIIGLFVATVLVSTQAYLGLPVLRGYFYLVVLALGADLVGMAAMVGVAMALYRRFFRGEARLAADTYSSNFSFFLTLLMAILLSGFAVEGLRIQATVDPWASWQPGGWVFASAFAGVSKETLLELHQTLWWVHAALSLLLIAYIPFSPLLHSVLAFFSVWNRAPLPAGTLPKPAGRWNGNFALSGDPRHLTRKQALDASACVECGRCQEVCPASQVERPLSPRRFLLSMRQGILERKPLNSNPDVIWSCTSCGACTEECPALIEHLPLMIDCRRFLVEKGNVPATMLQSLESMVQWGNPWNYPSALRWTWAENMRIPKDAEPGQRVELLYYLGCSACYDPVARTAAKSLIELLNRMNISYHVLGSREWCCGDMARRLGEEGLFRRMTARNTEMFAQLQPERMVTTCPHCYHAFKREYPGMPSRTEVIHYTSLLAELLTQHGLKGVRDLGMPVTFHDPCYLGRYEREFAVPRQILTSLPGVELKEMERNQASSFCCGGGGGQAWLDVRGKERMDAVRVREAAQSGAEKIITSCPYCQIMLNSSATASEASPKVLVQDIAEFVLERV